MKSDVFVKFATCWNLEFLDICGCSHIDDNAFVHLGKAEVAQANSPFPLKPGLAKLSTVRIQNCTKVTDYGIGKLIKVAPNIQHLELNCCSLTDFGLKAVFKELR